MSFTRLLHATTPSAWAKDVLNHEFDPWQRDLVDGAYPRVHITASRRAGKSETTVLRAVHFCMFNAGAVAVVLNPGLRQGTDLLRRAKAFFLAAGVGRFVQDAATSLELPNGSRFLSLSADPSLIRGITANRLFIICDEFAHFPSDGAQELLDAVFPTFASTSTTGALWLISSAYLRVGPHYDIAMNDDPSWFRVKVTATDIPHRIRPDFLEQQRLELDAGTFAREYMGEYTAIGEGASYFQEAALMDALSGLPSPFLVRSTALNLPVEPQIANASEHSRHGVVR